MPSKSKRGGGGGPLADYLEVFVASGKNEADKKFRRTQADTVAHELSLWNIPQQLGRTFVAYYMFVVLTGMMLNTTDTVDMGIILIQAAILYYLTLNRSVVAGGSVADVFTYMIAPVWTAMRAGNGSRLQFSLRAVVVNALYAGTVLAAAYAAAQTLTIINTDIVLTIPTVAGSTTQMSVVLAFLAVQTVALTWFDVLGVGDEDGAWLTHTSCEKNSQREETDRNRHALLAAASFLLIRLTTGLVMPFDIGYIFASWTQTTDANSYSQIFMWIFIGGIIALVVVGCLTFLDSDLALELSMSMRSGRGGRKHRYGKRRSRDDDDDEITGGDDEDNDDDDD